VYPQVHSLFLLPVAKLVLGTNGQDVWSFFGVLELHGGWASQTHGVKKRESLKTLPDDQFTDGPLYGLSSRQRRCTRT